MKNNFIKIVSILIIILSFFQNSFSDDFNFSVTEMLISENGNLIKGINGGTVTSNTNIIIVA